MALVMLQNYKSSNVEGMRKILKKFDKNVYSDSLGKLVAPDDRAGKTFYKNRVCKSAVTKDHQTQKLIEEVESTMIEIEGDRHKAMMKLRVPDLSTDTFDYPIPTVRALGFNLGIMVGLIGVLIYRISKISDDDIFSGF